MTAGASVQAHASANRLRAATSGQYPRPKIANREATAAAPYTATDRCIEPPPKTKSTVIKPFSAIQIRWRVL